MARSPSMVSNYSPSSTIVEERPFTERLSFLPKLNFFSHLFNLLNPFRIAEFFFEIFYRIPQLVIILFFKPTPPKGPKLPSHPYGRIAVIGAGLTGISSAAHCIAHNFEVTVYEANDEVGGIWSHVNSTSGLQLNSLIYRFHPGVLWKRMFPRRDEILHEIRRIWKEYQLEPRTKFNTPVKSVTRTSSSTNPAEYGHAKWIINETDGPYDAIIVTIGTCGEPMKIEFEGQENFNGQIVHSSELDEVDLEGKRVVIIGSGASGVEAAELAIEKKAKEPVIMVARDDKWIIPRNIFFDSTLSAQPFGRQMPFSYIPEWLIKTFHYRSMRNLAPYRLGIFEGTPVVNDTFLYLARRGKVSYVRGDIKSITENAIRVNGRARRSKPGDEGEEITFDADIIVLATGFKRPSIDFLPKDLFPERYQRPNLYLQNFSTEDWSILMTNSAYKNAIGTVGHFHIGMYTRILLVFLLDKNARPIPEDMKLWVDALRFLKRGSREGALGFFTYMELTLWLLSWHVFRLDRLRWMLFIVQGWGVYWSNSHKKVREGEGGRKWKGS